MASNSQIILSELIEHERKTTAPELSESKYFEIFSAEQILKNYGLSYDEIESGIVDEKGADGGIDGFYTFLNGILVTEETKFENIRENIVLRVYIIQAKTSPGFAEDAVLRIENTVKDLLDISHSDLLAYQSVYNPILLRAIQIFRDAYRALMYYIPELQISIHYVTKGDFVHPNLKPKATGVENTLKSLFTSAKADFKFVTAEDLFSLVRKSKIENLMLEVAQVLSVATGGAICLVPLKNYFDSICDKSTGDLRGWLFEENVRDYEGKDIEVNRGIRESLATLMPDKEFWWLNNGITIVAADSSLSSSIVTLSDPKIVNGLQTSMEIYNFFRVHNLPEDRNILVRIINTQDDKLRNEIIKATNSQSAIKPASLKAFDEIHYKIEKYLNLSGWYYERRKNFYKNQKKPKDKIISIAYMTQAVAAIILQRPNDSRGRPINLIKNPAHYNQIFRDSHPIGMYLECIGFMKAVDEYLSSKNAPSYVKGHEVNVRYQLAMFAAGLKTKKLSIKPSFFQKNRLGNPDINLLNQSVKKVWDVLQETMARLQVDEDTVAKSPEFDKALQNKLKETLIPNYLEKILPTISE